LSALRSAEADPDVGAIVITGNERVFAGMYRLSDYLKTTLMLLIAGADIKELASLPFPAVYLSDYLRGVSEGVSSFKKPIIAAVTGHAVS